MTSQISIKLLCLLTIVFLQCGACSAQNIKSPISPSKAKPSDENTKSDCDFNAYKPLTISHFFPNKVSKTVKPKYPTSAVSRGIEGWVMVTILVNIEGNVERACAHEGDEELRREAETAALQWKFAENFGFEEKVRVTKKKTDQKKYVQVVLPFHFVLKDDGENNGITVTPTQIVNGKTNDTNDE